MKATKVKDVVAIILNNKIIRSITREVALVSGVKVHIDTVKDIVENKILKSEVSEVNKKLLRILNTPAQKKRVRKEAPSVVVTAELHVENDTDIILSVDDEKRCCLSKGFFYNKILLFFRFSVGAFIK